MALAAKILEVSLTFTNILAPEADWVCLLEKQKTDMDFLSLENSSVNSFFISCLITWKEVIKRERVEEMLSLNKQHGEINSFIRLYILVV